MIEQPKKHNLILLGFLHVRLSFYSLFIISFIRASFGKSGAGASQGSFKFALHLIFHRPLYKNEPPKRFFHEIQYFGNGGPLKFRAGPANFLFSFKIEIMIVFCGQNILFSNVFMIKIENLGYKDGIMGDLDNIKQ